MTTDQKIEEIVEKLWWGGFGTHKASLVDDNAQGLRRLEDEQKAEAKLQLQRLMNEARLRELEMVYSYRGQPDSLTYYEKRKEYLTKLIGRENVD